MALIIKPGTQNLQPIENSKSKNGKWPVGVEMICQNCGCHFNIQENDNVLSATENYPLVRRVIIECPQPGCGKRVMREETPDNYAFYDLGSSVVPSYQLAPLFDIEPMTETAKNVGLLGGQIPASAWKHTVNVHEDGSLEMPKGVEPLEGWENNSHE